MAAYWEGVFPALTTQFHQGGELDLEATVRHAEVMISSGVTGLVMCGSLGENQTLAPGEKRSLVEATVDIAAGRVPVLSGVAETSTAAASAYVADCERLGAHGIMLMPPMAYRSDPREKVAFLRAVAAATSLPVMAYNNPVSYANDLTADDFVDLADVENLVAIKESAGDTRRITDLRNAVGDRYALFTGVDDLILESAVLGIDGWVAGLAGAFPVENQRLWELTRRCAWDEARELYRWFTPLLHLDVHPKFVQYIKLAVQECGLGAEWVRAPRLELEGDERGQVLAIIGSGIAARPSLDVSRVA